MKFKGDSLIDKHKARLVIKDFNQQLGFDYKHTFASVAKLAIVRVVIALAAIKSWPLYQLNINNASLLGYLNEDIYIIPLQGYSEVVPNQVCKLKKLLYGLKQTSKQWSVELTKFIIFFSFIQSTN